MPISSSLRVMALALFVAASLPHSAFASGLTVFKGVYGGKFTGVLVEASGATGRAVADAGTEVKATTKAAKFVISGTLSGVGYKQTISLAKGRATLNTLIPGGSGNLAKSAHGTYKARGKTATITLINPGGLSGKLVMKINFTTGGSTLQISTIITFTDGSDPVYSTVIGA